MPERRFILDNNLDRDVNAFVERIGEMPFNLLNRPHFRPQLYYIERTSPQILLRLENLENELEIIKAMVPGRFVGLKRENASASRASLREVKINLSPENSEIISNLYADDYRLLGYAQPNSEHATEKS